ncbi:MAG: endopeptidase La, partial [Ignavibacteriaceae bacterium]|nr:endopeptidase La [Ignavibacteriaceae bacterium]
ENKHVEFGESAIKKIISEYTREAGVRNLEREIASIFRKLAKEIVVKESNNGRGKKKFKHIITEELVEEYLKTPRFRYQRHNKGNKVGSVTGLAWTSTGGELLSVDVTIMNGAGKLNLTGQLGNVMKESAQAALSYLRASAKRLRLNPDFFKGREIHIHLPEGAIPKDGPSAGIAMAMAMLSAISGRPASNNVAMTGEITLTGSILAIGGLTEKLLAAKRNNIKTVLIPKENEIDLKEISDKVKSGLKIVPIDKVEQAIPYIFERVKMKKLEEKKNKK